MDVGSPPRDEPLPLDVTREERQTDWLQPHPGQPRRSPTQNSSKLVCEVRLCHFNHSFHSLGSRYPITGPPIITAPPRFSHLPVL